MNAEHEDEHRQEQAWPAQASRSMPANFCCICDKSSSSLTFTDSLTLSSGSTTVMELSQSPLTNDVARVLGVLTYGGTLTVLPPASGALAAGDTFRLFDAAEYNGSFAVLDLPPLGSGLAWETAALTVDGTLRVVSVAPPVITSVSAFGGNLIFSGTGGPAHGT